MPQPLKNAFDRTFVERLAAAAATTHPTFDTTSFTDAVMSELDDLELKDRINLIADQPIAHLDDDYETALPHVIATAHAIVGPPSDDTAAWGSGMEAWPLCSVVERHGLHHPEASIAAMEELTQSFSCEFAIRPYLDGHLDLTIAACRKWLRSPIPAVRRLPSEGTRPYLPWGPKVPALLDDPDIGLSLIRELRHDPDEVVRRSVANHLNDVARDHPDRVAAIAADWLDDPAVDTAMVRHALRSLIKKGHPAAMAALGYTTTASVGVDEFTVTPATIRLGDSITLVARLRSTSTESQRLVVDFVVHHVNANGGSSPKVFKWTTIELPAGDAAELTKTRRIQTASTRRYHAGEHRIELQVAGTAVAESGFDLLDSSS